MTCMLNQLDVSSPNIPPIGGHNKNVLSISRSGGIRPCLLGWCHWWGICGNDCLVGEHVVGLGTMIVSNWLVNCVVFYWTCVVLIVLLFPEMIWGCILSCPGIWHDLIFFQSLPAPAVICWTRFGKLKTHSSIIFQSESVYAWLQNHQLITDPLETSLKPKKRNFWKDIHLPSLGNDTNKEDPVIPLPRWGSSHGRSICRSAWGNKYSTHRDLYIYIHIVST